MPQCYTIVLARFLTDPVSYFVIFWLPEYLRKERGFSMAMVGAYAWIPFIFGDLGYITGRLALRLPDAPGYRIAARAQDGDRDRRRLSAAGDPGARWAPSAGLALAAICSVMFGHAVFVSNLQTLPTGPVPGAADRNRHRLLGRRRRSRRHHRQPVHRVRGPARFLCADIPGRGFDAPDLVPAGQEAAPGPLFPNGPLTRFRR